MNFYAHLVAASWHSLDPEFAAGAMLPDFATMAGVVLPVTVDGALGKGIRYHHECDRVFHSLGQFRDHERWALQHLQAAGLRRGPSRGIAHVGVELCLDGALVGVPETDALYQSSIEMLSRSTIEWDSSTHAKSFAHLVSRLQEFGVPSGYQKPDIVADRLIRILRQRPLLALSDIDQALLPSAIIPLHLRVLKDADQLMQTMANNVHRNNS